LKLFEIINRTSFVKLLGTKRTDYFSKVIYNGKYKGEGKLHLTNLKQPKRVGIER
jgi:hypothetical protein